MSQWAFQIWRGGVVQTKEDFPPNNYIILWSSTGQRICPKYLDLYKPSSHSAPFTTELCMEETNSMILFSNWLKSLIILWKVTQMCGGPNLNDFHDMRRGSAPWWGIILFNPFPGCSNDNSYLTMAKIRKSQINCQIFCNSSLRKRLKGQVVHFTSFHSYIIYGSFSFISMCMYICMYIYLYYCIMLCKNLHHMGRSVAHHPTKVTSSSSCLSFMIIDSDLLSELDLPLKSLASRIV